MMLFVFKLTHTYWRLDNGQLKRLKLFALQNISQLANHINTLGVNFLTPSQCKLYTLMIPNTQLLVCDYYVIMGQVPTKSSSF